MNSPTIPVQCTSLCRDEKNDDRDGTKRGEDEEKRRKDWMKGTEDKEGIEVRNHLREEEDGDGKVGVRERLVTPFECDGNTVRIMISCSPGTPLTAAVPILLFCFITSLHLEIVLSRYIFEENCNGRERSIGV